MDINTKDIQQNFNGSNIDGSFTTAVSTSFLRPQEKSYSCKFRISCDEFLFYHKNGILCVHNRIVSMRRF